MQQKELCLHCDPCPNSSRHIFEKVGRLFSPLAVFFCPFERVLQRFPQCRLVIDRMVFGRAFQTLLAFNVLREVEAKDSDEALYNRSLVLVREARKRGISMKSLTFFGKHTNYFSLEIRGVKTFFEGLPHGAIAYTPSVGFDDKGTLKELFNTTGIPHPQGRAFRTYVQALLYVRNTLGFPVVVKPRSGSLSQHTTCCIRTEEHLQEAINIARMICEEFVVEAHIEGDVHRVTMVHGNVVASCLREPPNIVGDAKHTIQELVDIKNQHPFRGAIHQKNFTLHKISLSARTHALLASQNLTLDYVPFHGEKIYLHDKVVLACGADIHDTTDDIHPENIDLFKRVYALCRAPLIGIDFITKDISKPYYEQPCAVIEVNSLPYIDMHHYPVTGKERNVAGHILDGLICDTI